MACFLCHEILTYFFCGLVKALQIPIKFDTVRKTYHVRESLQMLKLQNIYKSVSAWYIIRYWFIFTLNGVENKSASTEGENMLS